MSENHIRAISTALAILDEHLCEFESYSKGHEIHSALYEMRNHLTPAQRKRLASLVVEMKDVVRELKDVLGLDGKVREVGKLITTTCTVEWISLTEIGGKYLGRYGKPPPGLVEYLDPKLEFLIQRLRAVSRIAAGK